MAELLFHDDPASVTELTFDNHKFQAVSQLLYPPAVSPTANGKPKTFHPLSEYTHLEQISMNNCGVVSLEGFPALGNLQRLDLMDNKIAGGFDSLAKAGLENLSYLDLSNNRIADPAVLQPLAQLPSLKHLGLLQCPLTKDPNHRQTVFSFLPNLLTIDDWDREGNQVEEDDDGEEDDEEDEEEEEEYEEEDDQEGVPNGNGAQGADVEEYSDGEDEEVLDDDELDAEGEDDDDEQDGEGEDDQDGEGEEEEEEDEGLEEPEQEASPKESEDEDDEDDNDEGNESGYPIMGAEGVSSSHDYEEDEEEEDFLDDEGNLGLAALVSNQACVAMRGSLRGPWKVSCINLPPVQFLQFAHDDDDGDFQPGPEPKDYDFDDEDEEEDRYAETTPGYIPSSNKRKRGDFGEASDGPLGLGMDDLLGGAEQMSDLADEWAEASKRHKS
ncbi:hypothetical protein HK104_001214 [Borealophlyctis nickersoniae]|nr:hypothetical protein HK104_001214 [Borealophlyctis nickersoniae]